MSTAHRPFPFRRILVPVDGSAEVRAVVGAAARLAEAGGGEITLLGVLSVAVEVPTTDPLDPGDVATLSLLAEEEALVQRLAEVRLADARREIQQDVPVRI